MPDNENEAPRPPRVSEPEPEAPPAVTNAFEKADSDLTKVAEAVARGEWGQGQILRDRLTEAGYDHREIRKKIIEMHRG